MEVEADDEDLRRALELSMQPASPHSSSPEDDAAVARDPADAAIVDLTEDSFTEDPTANYTDSTTLPSTNATGRDDVGAEQRPKFESDSASKPANTVPGLSALDRKAMEQERLARAQSRFKASTPMPAPKREASISPPAARTTYGRENKRRRVEKPGSNSSLKEVIDLEAHTPLVPSSSSQSLPSSLPWATPSSSHPAT
ncbi:hypothetical protein LTS18_006685, partial [Coniosporium uncinatum]